MFIQSKLKKYLLQVLVLVFFIFIWWIVVKLFNVSEIIFPSPFRVFRLYADHQTLERISLHTWVTLEEALIGFLIGSLIGIILGYIVVKSKTLENILSPFIIAAQTTPKLALAPIFLIWFGFGIISKIFITALIVFFPIFINMAVAIKSINPNLREVMQLVRANKWQIFTKLEWPSSLPLLFAGFKSGITLAVVGAVVGEFVGANSGLGYLIIFSMGHLDTPMVFVAIIQLIVLSIILYEMISILGTRFMRWHESEKGS